MTLEKYDRVTRVIGKALKTAHIPWIASAYARSPLVFNYMLVGASGTVLNWLIYEHAVRPVFVIFGQIGTFTGIVVTTVLVFLWNYFWNKRWSLNAKSQILKMSDKERQDTKRLLDEL